MIEMRTLAFSFLMSMALQAIVIGLLWMQNRKRFAGLVCHEGKRELSMLY